MYTGLERGISCQVYIHCEEQLVISHAVILFFIIPSDAIHLTQNIHRLRLKVTEMKHVLILNTCSIEHFDLQNSIILLAHGYSVTTFHPTFWQQSPYAQHC
jgi:hypothetical protein